MSMPFIVLADNDCEHKKSFTKAFEKQVAYASIVTRHSGRSLLSFLRSCDWNNLPDLIVLNYQLSDMTAPEVLRQLLTDSRCREIPKVVCVPDIDKNAITECWSLGARHFLKKDDGLFECESVVREIDTILKAELSL